MTTLLELEQVNKHFGGLHAVRDLSFTVQEGEILGLIGPNGAGKTTVFNLINGVLTADTGRIVLNGTDIRGYKPYHVARCGIARTHQIVQPLANMTVLDNCTVSACFGRDNLPLARAREAAVEAIAISGLESRTAMLATHLTIAWKKRLELARALAGQPSLLLLDEVLAGLNPSEIRDMVPVIQAIQKRGITIVMIEHVMQAVMSLASQVFVLAEGRMIAMGPPQAIAADKRVIEAYLGHGAAARLQGAAHG